MVSICFSFDDLDFIVDAFEFTGMNLEFAMIEDAITILVKSFDE